MDYLVSVTDLKVFGCCIDFLQTATQTYLEDPIWDKLQQGMEYTIVFRNCSVILPSQVEFEDCPIHHIPLPACSLASCSAPTVSLGASPGLHYSTGRSNASPCLRSHRVPFSHSPGNACTTPKAPTLQMGCNGLHCLGSIVLSSPQRRVQAHG